MRYYELKYLLRKSNISESVRYYLELIELTTEGKILINGINTKFKNIKQAKQHIKEDYAAQKIIDKVTKETYQEISEQTIAGIIKDHHNIKVTDTLIESYLELATLNMFSTDPVVQKIRSLNKLDRVVEGKLHYVLADKSIVAINTDTQDILNKLLGNQIEIIEYMRKSKENFFNVLEQIEE